MGSHTALPPPHELGTKQCRTHLPYASFRCYNFVPFVDVLFELPEHHEASMLHPGGTIRVRGADQKDALIDDIVFECASVVDTLHERLRDPVIESKTRRIVSVTGRYDGSATQKPTAQSPSSFQAGHLQLQSCLLEMHHCSSSSRWRCCSKSW